MPQFPSRLGWTLAPLVWALGTSLASLSANAAPLYTGTNLAGADFGESVLPGTYNTNYTYPTTQEVDYFLGKGANTFRLPFRWERLQPTLNSALNATELSRMDTFVNYATSHGAYVLLDPHNYARYWVGGRPGGTEQVVGSAGLPNATFADFWTRLANQYKANSHVIFGLINEPNSMSTEQWAGGAQAAINAIRGTGASNLILVPGNAWTGAHSWTDNWYGTPNSQVMLSITDPGSNFAFDVHQYLDSDSSGSSDFIVSSTIGRDRLVNFTNWLHTNNRRGFLGEFGVANSRIGNGGSQIGDEALQNMLGYISTNSDVWLGWTWWAAGPWWGDYMFTAEPTNLGQPTQTDRPVLGALQPFFVGLSGDFDDNGTVNAADIDILWHIVRGTGADPGSNDSADLNGDGVANEDDVDTMLAAKLTIGTGRRYGDADLIGGVGPDDFTAWRIGGAGWAHGDFDGTGDVGPDDFTLWRTAPTAYPSNVGPRPGSEIASVPEPSGLVLFGAGLSTLVAGARRRRAA